MAQRGPTRPTARIEEAIGFVGMFGVLFLGVTVFCEVTGRPALAWALTLLAAVVALVVLDRWRVTVLRRHTVATGEVDGVGAAPTRSAQRVGAGVAAGGHAHVGFGEVAAAERATARARSRTAALARQREHQHQHQQGHGREPGPAPESGRAHAHATRAADG